MTTNPLAEKTTTYLILVAQNLDNGNVGGPELALLTLAVDELARRFPGVAAAVESWDNGGNRTGSRAQAAVSGLPFRL